MNQREIDVFGVGNAIVDTLAFVDADFIRERGYHPGVMTLVDADRQAELLLALKDHPLELRSGGSAANTMIGIVRSGGSGFYSGKVARDTNGEFYRMDLLKAGLHFDVHPIPDENHGPSGTCVVLTTPDAERTMFTHLGVSTMLGPDDIDEGRLKRCKYSYAEGYLWTGESTKAALHRSMELSKKNGVKVAFSFSDPWLVNLAKDEFRALASDFCDVIFCNAEEAKGFTDKPTVEEGADAIGSLVKTAFITNGSKGCIVVHEGLRTEVEGFKVNAVDTNGAGDAFAGGVLYGLTHGMSVGSAARWGNFLASRVVQVHGARIEESQREMVERIIKG
jgi:sugar/nucleoside kinase (ribokinase family)